MRYLSDPAAAAPQVGFEPLAAIAAWLGCCRCFGLFTAQSGHGLHASRAESCRSPRSVRTAASASASVFELSVFAADLNCHGNVRAVAVAPEPAVFTFEFGDDFALRTGRAAPLFIGD